VTYDYKCTGCEHEWEASQSIREQPLELCPSCGEKTAKRMISKPGEFLLTGGGWYADGYGRKRASDE